MKVLVLAEHQQQKLKSSFYHVITAAKQLSDDITVMITGYQLTDLTQQISAIQGIKKIIVADNKVYEHQLAENTSLLIASLANNYQYILAPANSFGKNLLPRIAALLDVSCVSDVTKIISPDTFIRPIYAGNALATIQSTESIKLLLVRSTAFAASKELGNVAPIEQLDSVYSAENIEFVSYQGSVSERPSLNSAKIIISGGRGLGSAENFKILMSLADKLGAAVGASRAAVDAGYVPNDFQVGQTGKIVAPELYIAVGISGAIQHLAGMKESKVIVAINKDKDAPIFKVADYGLVGDLFEILPQLEKAITVT